MKHTTDAELLQKADALAIMIDKLNDAIGLAQNDTNYIFASFKHNGTIYTIDEENINDYKQDLLEYQKAHERILKIISERNMFFFKQLANLAA